MIEVRVLIPLADNAGTVFAADHHAGFELHAAEQFGGFTLLPGESLGGWMNEGSMYADRLRLYVVFVEGIIGDGYKILGLVAFAKAHYGQLAISVLYLGQSEIL